MWDTFSIIILVEKGCTLGKIKGDTVVIGTTTRCTGWGPLFGKMVASMWAAIKKIKSMVLVYSPGLTAVNTKVAGSKANNTDKAPLQIGKVFQKAVDGFTVSVSDYMITLLFNDDNK